MTEPLPSVAPDRVRALAERLIAVPSASPDREAETHCARVLAAAWPEGPNVEKGEWITPDGRPVPWCFVRGRSRRTVTILGHYDTVGVRDYEAIGARNLACDPPALAAFLDRHARASAEPDARLIEDLDEERRAPGTWVFGRGALDMKSGLAAGIEALRALAAAPQPLEGGVVMIATPDEEYVSEGMLTVTHELVRWHLLRALDPFGVINLDYGLEPALYRGVAGKVQLGCFVLGEPAHVADPGRASNALEIAARIVIALTAAPGLEAAPTVLALEDGKRGYSIEPPIEALAEFSVPWIEGSLDRLLGTCRDVVASCWNGAPPGERRGSAMLLSDLGELENQIVDEPRDRSEMESVVAAAGRSPVDRARSESLHRLRRLCRSAGVRAPAVVLHLLPPFYPPAAPGEGPFTRAAIAWAEAEGVVVRGRYPFISDASYVAWRAAPRAAIAQHLPSLGRGYDLPIENASALDLEVVNLGPWGRDAHRPYERVHAPWAFGELPGKIARLVRAAWNVEA